MNKLILCVALAALLVHIHTQQYYGVYAFSWFAGHCQQLVQGKPPGTLGCDPEKVKLWDHQSFTIHGMWPSTTASDSYGAFDLSIIQDDKTLEDEMYNYWPPQSKDDDNPYFLWSHEWTKHGSDYAQQILELEPDRFSGEGEELNKQLQRAFYDDVLGFYKRFPGVQKYPSRTLTKQSFARILGIKADQLTLSCVKANILREIKVCYQLTPNGPIITKCISSSNTGCSTKYKDFELPDWKQSNQERVFDYPPSEEN